ncbi:hypothetical protein [Amycolatopsis sp. CA-230715]|uniref:hypothetical protein n=1 Tax=Amycolatopsis sp. CA-230715 TaxID=2745196 RepID=UPI001C03A326|nr:hypothetical protein [Amycolatopsis sp. CA-230715]
MSRFPVLLLACLLLSSCAAPPPPRAEEPVPGPLLVEPGSGGIRLVLPTSPPMVVENGRARPIPGIPAGDRVTSVVRVGTTPVLLSARRCGPSCTEPADVYAWSKPLGRAYSVAPAADGTAVWMIRDGGTPCLLQRVPLDGTAPGEAQPASCQTAVRGEDRDGLLITVNSGRPEALDVLIDPGTGRTVQQFPRIAAVAGGSLLALGLVDFTAHELGTGRSRTVPRPVPNGRPGVVVPSRDGRLLAVPFEDLEWHGGTTRSLDLWVLDLDGGDRWTHAPSMPVSTDFTADALDWTADGDLVLTGTFAGKTSSAAAWRPGESRWRSIASELPPRSNRSVVALP